MSEVNVYKIDLNKPIVNLDGEQVMSNKKAATCASVLADHLAYASKGNSIKCFDFAMRLSKGEVFEVDEVDFQFLKAEAESMDFAPLSKAPILKILGNTKPKGGRPEDQKD